MSKVGEHYREKEEMDMVGEEKIIPTKACDGDCGRGFYKTDLNLTCYNDYFCKECMFDFMAEQERKDETHQH